MSSYKLPTGETVTSRARYFKAWAALYKPNEVAFGVRCAGFDPSLSFTYPDEPNTPTWQLPTREAIRLVEILSHRKV
jgi:hypothetical protein